MFNILIKIYINIKICPSENDKISSPCVSVLEEYLTVGELIAAPSTVREQCFAMRIPVRVRTGGTSLRRV